MIDWEASLKELNEARRSGDFVKVATVELTRGEAERIHAAGLFVVNGRGVWQIDYSTAQNTFCGRLIVHAAGLTKRGRFYVMDAAAVNKLLGAEIVGAPETV